jgi:PQ loop repeat.
MWITNFVETIFGLSLFVNSCLFIPQIIKLYQKKDSSEVSLLTFGGFNVIQLFAALHGHLHHDWILMTGELLSLFSCGCVSFLIVWYRLKSRVRVPGQQRWNKVP